jgi:hypothetical protein
MTVQANKKIGDWNRDDLPPGLYEAQIERERNARETALAVQHFLVNTDLYQLASNVHQLKSVPILSLLLGMLALTVVGVEAYAQDLEPRAYANAPTGLNFLIGGYAYSKGIVRTDPSVPLKDAELKLDSLVLAYVRTLDLWGRSGKFDLIVPYNWVSGKARLSGQPRKRDVSGFGDPKLRLSMLLYGAPALSLDDFRNYKPDIIVGTSVEISPPLGQYNPNRLVNVGTNRWSFKPEVGLSKTLGPLTLELATGVRWYTANDDFLGNKTLQLDPVFSLQGHLIYSFETGLWLGVNGMYYFGGRRTIDGQTGERLENLRMGLTAAVPIHRYHSIKLYGSTSVHAKSGPVLDMVGVVWQFRWGTGL